MKDDAPDEYKYVDVFSDDTFLWESQRSNSQATDKILRIISLAVPVLLFCRLASKLKGKTVPFTYVGTLTAIDYSGDKPVSFKFEVDDYQSDPSDALRELYNWRPGDVRKLKPLEDVDRVPRLSSGQGRQSDPKKKKATEMRAMEAATAHYSEQGWAVRDTSANMPYDLECERDDEICRVEVKGLMGTLGPVHVTWREVDFARDNSIVTNLFILHSIEVVQRGSDYLAHGGTSYVESDWSPDNSQLKPTMYTYTPAGRS